MRLRLLLLSALLSSTTLHAAGGAFHVRAFPSVGAAESSRGDREPSGAYWFGTGLYDNAKGFYVPRVQRLRQDGSLSSFILDEPQSFFASAVVRDHVSGVVWILVPRIDVNGSRLYALDPATNAVTRTDVPFRASSLALDPVDRAPWVSGDGKVARLGTGSFRVYGIPGFAGRASRFDAQRRLWMGSDNGTLLCFTTPFESLDTFGGGSIVDPDVDPSGLIWGMSTGQRELVRFNPFSFAKTTWTLAHTAANWDHVAAGGDNVVLASSYGPHFLSHTVAELTGAAAGSVSGPFGSRIPPATVAAPPTALTATRTDETVSFEDRIAYAENDGGRHLFTQSGAGFSALLWNGDGEALTATQPLQIWRSLQADETFETRAALPVAVEVRPDDPTTNFFTEVAVTNVDADPSATLVFRTSAGEYTAPLGLAQGQTRVFGNIIETLRSLGAAIPSGSSAGTLSALFANGSGALSARVFTRVPGGATTGLGYSSLDPSNELFATRKALNGLKQTATFRTNVAVANLCGSDTSCGTLEMSARFSDDATGLPVGTVHLTVPPHEWRQLDAPLAGFAGASGESFSVTFSPDSGGVTGYDAYATVIDNRNQDASFFRASAIAGSSNATLPVVTDAGGIGTRFTSEASITNTDAVPLVADVTFTSAISGASVSEVLNLATGHGVRYPNAVAHFRALDPAKVGADDYGPVRVAFRDFARGFASSRTTAANGTGLGFVAIDPTVARAQRKKRIVGLKQTAGFRTNLAVVHCGATTNETQATIGVKVTVFDAAGKPVGAPLTQTLAPGRLYQWTKVLEILGVSGEGYVAVIERTDGYDAFDAYVTIIDSVSSDPTFLRAE